MFHAPRIIPASVVITAACTAQAQPFDYTFVGLDQAGINYSRAWEINDSRQVALEAGAGVGGTRAYRYVADTQTFVALPTLGGAVATVRSISANGDIVGNSYGSGGLFDQRAALWRGNSAIDVGRPADPFDNNNFARDINENGIIVGRSSAGWTWNEADGYQILSAINGSSSSSPNAINENDWVVGSSSSADGTRATVWKPDGSIMNLGLLPDAAQVSSVALGVNDNNQVVGYSGDPLGFSNAFLWSEDDGLVNLGAPGGRSSFANDINNDGMIVGYASFSAGPQQRAYMWFEGQAYDLNDFIDPGSGWVLTEAYGINELGDIVGRGRFNGQTQAFMLQIPAPSTLGFVVLAAAANARRRR